MLLFGELSPSSRNLYIEPSQILLPFSLIEVLLYQLFYYGVARGHRITGELSHSTFLDRL
jgi:hypothetical protein